MGQRRVHGDTRVKETDQVEMRSTSAVAVLALLVFAAAAAASAVRATSGFDNFNPYLALDVDPATSKLVVAFSASSVDDTTGKHFGLDIRKCTGVNGTTDCHASSSITDVDPLLVDCSFTNADGWNSIIVQDISLQVSSSYGASFSYVMFTEWVQTPINPDPNQNTVVMYYCNTSDCSQPAGNYENTITQNGYYPSFQLIKTGLLGGKSYPAITYVSNPGLVNPVPSEQNMGDAWLLFCGDVSCSDLSSQTLMHLDACPDASNFSSCSHTQMTVDNNGCPQVMLMGPSRRYGGSWLKVISCNDTNPTSGCTCANTIISDVVLMSNEITAFPGEAQIFTRAAGHPAMVFIDQSATAVEIARCRDYVCAQGQVTFDILFNVSATNQYVTSPAVTVLDSQLPVVVFCTTTTGGLGALARDLYIVYCTQANCLTFTAPQLITPSNQQPLYAGVTMLPNEQLVVSYYDEVSLDGWLILCDAGSCTSDEIANRQSINTLNIACFPYAPSPPAAGRRGKSGGVNGGAVAAGVILSLVFLGGVGFFAYYWLVVRPGGQWPWAKIGQAKGLDQYAEL
eukprot:Amastigsp_a174379_739.p1 type:complete len:568 gc:universal Amastigsp_a174379_739:1736-33(-)